ncbi:hypothetical protein Y032_0330g2698 [Ancylostoma ceylanicum]|nr:hypothetical protein Y032_0330g2698 [Ancylostoma ceylanicum]
MPEVYPFIRIKDRDAVELVFMFVCIAGIPFTFVALVIIFTKTPPQMKTYKWIIANLTVTSFLTGIVICFLFDPIPLFPEVACYSKTWIANVCEDANYILLCASIVMLQFTLSSTLVAFIYRMNSLRILSEKFLIFSNCGIQYTTAAAYVLSLIPVVVVLVTGYKPNEEMRGVLEKTPELKFLQDYGSYLAADKDDWNLVIFQVIWLSSSFAIVALCIIVAVAIIVQLHRKRQFMSSKSLALHRSLTIQLTVQVTTLSVNFDTFSDYADSNADIILHTVHESSVRCRFLELGNFANGRSAQSTEYCRYHISDATLSQSIRQAIQEHFLLTSRNKIEFCNACASWKKQRVHLTTNNYLDAALWETTLE